MTYATFLDGRPPEQLRGLAWLSMSESGSVLNRAGTTDSGGGATTTWTAGSVLPCRVDALTGTEAEVGERIVDRSTHLVTLPAYTEVGHEDRVATDDAGTFEITAVRQRTREWVRLCEAVRLD